MNQLAKELNQIIQEGNPHLYEMLSRVGKGLFFPRGILAQSAEAKEKAYRFNATIGIATEKGQPMHLPSITKYISGLAPSDSLTYAPSFGVSQLRTLWRETMLEKNPSLAGKSISLPIVTNAITHGLSIVADMWVDPGDVVILPDKTWGNYNLIFSVRHHAQISHFSLFTQDGRFNISSFREVLRKEGKKNGKIAVILNFPNNPTGYTVNEQEANSIVEALTELTEQGVNVIAATDDAYFGLFFEDDTIKESLFGRLAGIHPRLLAIKLDGSTKEDYVWGLRVGFITYGTAIRKYPERVYNALERKTAGAVRGSISNSSHLSQTILLKGLQSESYRQEKEEKFKIMKQRANRVKEVLSDPKYKTAWEVYPFNSGYFMCIKLKTVEAEPLRLHLLNKYGVGLISIGKTDLRIAFSCLEQEHIQELFDIVLQGVRDLEG
nr:aminotransferase class I/II-fold pyridoxal phosphate-dependent enzyme [Desulfobacterales bacterium]